MLVFIKNKGEINLTKANFINQGGEGSVYAKGKTAYKIYTDISKMIPLGKIQELSEITEPNVIRPVDVILNKNNKPIGYSMRFVKQTYALCQLFTKSFREREGLKHDTIQSLIKKLRAMIEHIHSKNILLVDVNEMNFLVNKNFNEIYAIDTDSYQTINYPATAIMDSVRDRHSKTFNKNTDWFSFGIIAFQMFIGIHPYKGRHPTIKQLNDRMIKNISVLNKDVSVPQVCYPFDIIPETYRNWFCAIFENGKRIPPPTDFQSIAHIITTIKKITGSNNFDITEENEYDGNILSILFTGGKRAVLTDKKFYLNHKTFNTSNNIKLAITPKSDMVLLVKIENGLLKLFNTETNTEISTQLGASDLMTYNGNIYVKNIDRLLEIDLTEIKHNNILVSSKVVANLLENASTLYDGVVVQNLLGAYYISIFPSFREHQQLHIKELDEYRIIDAKFNSNILMIVGIKNGQYDRFVFRFSKDWHTYDIRKVENITHTGLNFIVLDNGVCIHLTEEENIEIFSNRKDSPNIKVIEDPVLGGDMKLFHSGSKVYFGKHNKLCTMKMK